MNTKENTLFFKEGNYFYDQETKKRASVDKKKGFLKIGNKDGYPQEIPLSHFKIVNLDLPRQLYTWKKKIYYYTGERWFRIKLKEENKSFLLMDDNGNLDWFEPDKLPKPIPLSYNPCPIPLGQKIGIAIAIVIVGALIVHYAITPFIPFLPEF